MKTIDLRSDTVTRPSREMLAAMSAAEVGDDVYGDDPTVNLLEQKMAEKLGFDAALFAPSGTQANLVALMSHCQRGDEYIVGQHAHTYKYEAGGAAVLGSIQPQPIEFEDGGLLDLTKVKEKIKPDDFHFAKTRLLCLENTQNGCFLPLDYLEQAETFTKKHGLQLHLDGARLFNAVVACEVNPKEITSHFDSVSVCLSKGLGAPVGSVLCGSREFIGQARRWRKMVGGGMRQAGLLAAAGLYALEHNVDRLRQDHENARRLELGLQEFAELKVHHHDRQTNMVFFDTSAELATELGEALRQRNILVSPGATTRMVTHLDISQEDVSTVLAEVARFFEDRE